MYNIQSILKVGLLSLVFLFAGSLEVDAAALKVSPATGVYSVGKVFTVSVMVSTDGKPVNAADGQLSFNPRELQVVGVSRASSIFNLWTEEPAFSNSAGTISFGGGSPSGYKGASGSVITISLKALAAGTPKINFKSGSILAADGMGTNILTGMSGGTFTVSAPTEDPEPEYIAPANTPKAPSIASGSHPDQNTWYKEKTVTLTWGITSDVTAVRMSLDSAPGTIPTNVYEERLTSKTIEDLDEGTSYFHLQFKNADGWGRVSHYKISIDTVAPESFSIVEATSTEDTFAGTKLNFVFEDSSPVPIYKIQIDGAEPIEYEDEKLTKSYVIDALPPGNHTVVVEAIDSAGNSALATYSFTTEAFEKPVFTDYPERINTDVIPAIKGTTRPNAQVAVEIRRASDNSLVQVAEGAESGQFTVESDENGNFVFVPNESFEEEGVYILTAIARDSAGRMSERSDEIRIIVETPGYIAAGAMAVDIISIVVPIVAMLALMAAGAWYFWFRFVRWRRKIRKETAEVEDRLTLEFNEIITNLHTRVDALKHSRKGKLTIAETELIEQIELDLKNAREKIQAEIDDIEDIVA